jgi:hypothetical protein
MLDPQHNQAQKNSEANITVVKYIVYPFQFWEGLYRIILFLLLQQKIHTHVNIVV